MWDVFYVPTKFSNRPLLKNPLYPGPPPEHTMDTKSWPSRQQIHTNLIETIFPREIVYTHIFK